MRFFRLQPGDPNRYLLAIFAGLLMAASFPKLHLAGLAWIAPGLILGAAMGTRGATAFRLGYLAGLTNYLTALYWLLLIPVSFAPIVGWLALSGVLACFTAFWVWLAWKIYPSQAALRARVAEEDHRQGNTAVLDGAESQSGLAALLESFLSTSWLQRLAWSFCCAALWVALEMIQTRIFTGFPWNFLGASQYQLLPLIQISSITGVYGVSFLLAWFSVSLLAAGAAVMRRPGAAWLWGREFLLPLLVVVIVLATGMHRILTAPEPAAQLKVLMVQPSIPQTVIWDEKESGARFKELMQLSEQGLTNKPDLMLWPEAAVPTLFRWDPTPMFDGQNIYEAVTGLVRRYQVWLIMGADDAQPRQGAPGGADYYNSSFLISPGGELRASYRKQKLVVFGEYVPLSRYLPFLMDFTQVHGAFTPGTGPVTFNLPELRVKTSVLICFEDIFPQLARHAVHSDTDFLVNLTNNGWFGESAAQWQHAANAVFRAVENGLPLIRATNNGLTCWVDAYGGLHDVHYPGFKNIYQAGFKIAHIPLLEGQKRSLTFYTRYGDVFGWTCVGLSAVVVFGTVLTRRWAARLFAVPA